MSTLAMIFLTLTALAGLSVTIVNAECRAPSDIPAVTGSGTFTCAYLYDGNPNDQPVNSCNGFEHQLDEHSDLNEPPCGWHYVFSAAIIRPGCQIYLWDDCNFAGNEIYYEGPAVVPHIPENSVGSLKCRCGSLRHVTCIPTDKMEHVLGCDALQATEPTSCIYSFSIGTTYESSLSESMSIDVTIEMALEMEFFGLFSYHLGMSMTTGYDWTTTSSQAMQSVTSYTVDAVAPPGQLLTIEQASGYCDGSGVFTEYFKITHSNKDGEVLDVYWQKALPDGTLVRADPPAFLKK